MIKKDQIARYRSPCRGLCAYDEAEKLCTGCYRTKEDITIWRQADVEQKQVITQKADERRRKESHWWTKDQLGETFLVPQQLKRIISLVPSQSEFLFDLGLGERLVGVTSFCIYPRQLHQQATIVGGTKNVNEALIASLKPDLIVANKEENTPSLVASLRRFCPVWVTDVKTIRDVTKMMRRLGELVDRIPEAETIVQRVNKRFPSVLPNPTSRVAYLIWRDPWMVAGGDTFISHCLQHSGYENVFADRKRYPKVSIEDIKTAKPDKLLFSSEPFPFKQRHLLEMQDQLPDIVCEKVDGKRYSWYGSRLIK